MGWVGWGKTHTVFHGGLRTRISVLGAATYPSASGGDRQPVTLGTPLLPALALAFASPTPCYSGVPLSGATLVSVC